MQNLASDSTITEAIVYWEDEKRKALQHGATKHTRLNPKREKVISKLLPRWERQKQKRLGKAQALLNAAIDSTR